jgi:putative membrane protein
MMGWYGGGMAGGAWVFMGLFWIVLIAAIIWLVVRLLPSGNHGHAAPTPTAPLAAPPAPGPRADSPLEILDRRLALGEIDLETYQAHRAAIVAARGGVQ